MSQLPDAITRRGALRLLGAGGLASLAACSRPHEEIAAQESFPYVSMPEGMVPGETQRYATTLELAGRPRGVIVTAFEGRPIKIDGNPRHPASLGATDVFAEAEILTLYDPDRSQTPRFQGEPIDAPAMQAALASRRELAAKDKGAGLRLLTGRISSPTLLDQISGLAQQFPAMRWHVFEPTEVAPARAPEWLADPSSADVIAVFAADPLGPGPDQIRFARKFAQRRGAQGTPMRLYAAEWGPSLTGAVADERLVATPDVIARMLLALGRALGVDAPATQLTKPQQRFVEAVARDIGKRRGLVLAGPWLPTDIQAFAHAINQKIGAPAKAFAADPALASAANLAELATDLDAGRVQSLIVVDCNPAQDAPGDLDFGDLIARAPWRLHLGGYFDETARLCQWHAPMAHALESWSDARFVDGTASLVQPLIRPLYQGHTKHGVIAALAG